MSPATVWTALTTPNTGYQEALPEPSYDASTDYFIDVLFEGTSFFAVLPASYTELTVAASSHTELTVPATSYTELTL